MMYRLGQRAKFRRVRRIRYYSQYIRLGVAVVLVGAGIFLLVVYAAYTPKNQPPEEHAALRRRTSTGSNTRPPAGSTTVAGSNPLRSMPASTLLTADCDDFPATTPGLAGAANTTLRKLAQYQQACNGQLAARSSFFVPTPATVAEAQSYAADTIADLKAYAQYGITPLVFMEPDSATGVNLDLSQYRNGAYDSALDAYFADIKAAGVTDAMMGMWVMLPEGNLPEWTSVDPATFVADVTKVAQFQKKYFPASQTSIMLSSETYPSASSWNGGAYVSLLPYVQGMPKGLIDSFGLEGFPWAPPANQGGGSLSNPQVYLRTDLAASAARALGIPNIWLNTGTFSQMYTNDAAQTITDTPLQRQTMLNSVLTEARGLQSQGFNVSVHLFAQDKSGDSEGINWSYWQTPGDSSNTSVFEVFVHDLSAAHIPLWIFDTY